MKKRVTDLLRRFGVKMILKEIIAFLESTDDENLDILREDIDAALKSFEERERNSGKDQKSGRR